MARHTTWCYGGLGARRSRKFNTNDILGARLATEAGLPWETTLYVPKILATAILPRQPARVRARGRPARSHGNRRTRCWWRREFRWTRWQKLASVSSETIENLNPQYLAGRTPPPASGAPGQSWRVRLPVGKGASVQAGLARLALKDESYRPYVVKRGETLESIAVARGTTEAQLRLINQVAPKEVLVAGAVLLVPEPEPSPDDDAGRRVAVVPRARSRPNRGGCKRVTSGDRGKSRDLG